MGSQSSRSVSVRGGPGVRRDLHRPAAPASTETSTTTHGRGIVVISLALPPSTSTPRFGRQSCGQPCGCCIPNPSDLAALGVLVRGEWRHVCGRACVWAENPGGQEQNGQRRVRSGACLPVTWRRCTDSQLTGFPSSVGSLPTLRADCACR